MDEHRLRQRSLRQLVGGRRVRHQRTRQHSVRRAAVLATDFFSSPPPPPFYVVTPCRRVVWRSVGLSLSLKRLVGSIPSTISQLTSLT
jgi:hypothetical protein